jgi:hypothetical protein
MYVNEEGDALRRGICICKLPEDYKYSSALFYETGNDNPSTSSGRISHSSSGLNYRSVVGGGQHQLP